LIIEKNNNRSATGFAIADGVPPSKQAVFCDKGKVNLLPKAPTFPIHKILHLKPAIED
jgi:hypothetical protein